MNNEKNNLNNSQPMNGQPQMAQTVNNSQPMSGQPQTAQTVNNSQPMSGQPQMVQTVNNSQPMNGQPQTAQTVNNSQPMSGQPQTAQTVNNSQPMSGQPQMVQTVNNSQPMNGQPQTAQTVNNSQPMSGQPQMAQLKPNDQYQNNGGHQNLIKVKNDNKLLFIIFGVVVLIIVAVVVLVFILNGNKSKGNTINDFESNKTTSEENNNDNQQESDTNSITFKGFSIPKKSGYVYDVDTVDGLLIINDTYATIVDVIYGSVEQFNSIKDEFILEYADLGMTLSNDKVLNYDGKTVLSMEISMNEQKAVLYIMDAGNNYVFIGQAMNPLYVIDYIDVETSISLLSNAKYTGEYKINVDENHIIEFRDLFE